MKRFLLIILIFINHNLLASEYQPFSIIGEDVTNEILKKLSPKNLVNFSSTNKGNYKSSKHIAIIRDSPLAVKIIEDGIENWVLWPEALRSNKTQYIVEFNNLEKFIDYVPNSHFRFLWAQEARNSISVWRNPEYLDKIFELYMKKIEEFAYKKEGLLQTREEWRRHASCLLYAMFAVESIVRKELKERFIYYTNGEVRLTSVLLNDYELAGDLFVLFANNSFRNTMSQKLLATSIMILGCFPLLPVIPYIIAGEASFPEHFEGIEFGIRLENYYHGLTGKMKNISAKRNIIDFYTLIRKTEFRPGVEEDITELDVYNRNKYKVLLKQKVASLMKLKYFEQVFEQSYTAAMKKLPINPDKIFNSNLEWRQSKSTFLSINPRAGDIETIRDIHRKMLQPFDRIMELIERLEE